MLSSIDLMKYNVSVMMQDYKSYNTYWLTLELMLRMKPRLIEIGEKYKLTTQQMHVLAFLADGQPHPMSWLAALLFCDASNVTGIVDRMISLDLIKRTECVTDRRVKMAQLTPKGEEVRSTIMAEISIESQKRVDNILSVDEQRVFRELVIKLLEATESDLSKSCPASKK